MQLLFYFPYQQSSSGSSSSVSQGIFDACALSEWSSVPRALFFFSDGIAYALAVDTRPGKQSVFKYYYSKCEELWRDCANKTVVSLLGFFGVALIPRRHLRGQSNLKGL